MPIAASMAALFLKISNSMEETMKKLFTLILLLSFLTISFPANASSGDGFSFRINNFLLRITWSWQREVPTMDSVSAIPLINLIHSNYLKVSSTNKKVWFDYYYNKENKTLSLSKYLLVKDQWELIEEREFPESFDLCSELIESIKKELGLPVVPNFISNVYVVFIPNEYIYPDSTYLKEVETFLEQSELYFAHDAVIQNNIQGYVYSIFFDKHMMYSLLEKLNVKRIIINRKTLNNKGMQSFNIMLP